MKKLFLLLFFAIFCFAVSIEKLESECNLGNDKSCYLIGKAYLEGKVIKKDYAKAVNFFIRSCKLGNSEACYGLGVFYAKGIGVEKNVTKAINIFKWICLSFQDQYALKACDIANVFFRRKDYKTAAVFFKRACKLGDKKSCYRYLEALNKLYQTTKDVSLLNEIGLVYYNGDGIHQDYKKALQFFKKGCKLGDKICCFNAGIILNNGFGVEKNQLRALQFFKKGCELGDSDCCNNTGYFYYKNKNLELAIKFFKRGCQLNSGLACFNLGFTYLRNNEYNMSFKYFLKSCKLNYKDGCYNVATMFKEGKGVNTNYQMAIKYYEKSCFDLNDTRSCRAGANLAMELFNSDLVLKFYRKGCQLGDSYCCRFLDVKYKQFEKILKK